MQRSRLAGLPADYKKPGVAPVEVAEFEEGQRIDTERGRYEWWYFDSHPTTAPNSSWFSTPSPMS